MTGQARPRGVELMRNPRWVEASRWLNLENGGSEIARQALFEQYLPFARKIAADQYYRRRPDNFELVDLEQWAIEALLTCIDRFDPRRSVPFTAFARRRIGGNIADGISSMSEIGRQSRHVYLLERDRIRSLKKMTVKDDAAPLDQLKNLTIGLALGVMLEGTGIFVDEEKPSTSPTGYDSLLWKNTIKKLTIEYERLPDPQPFIIRQHYQNGISFAQIAKLLGLSKGRISQLHRKALELLRRRLGKL